MLDVMIITKDEEINLPHCLEALTKWANKVFVVDSGSTDRTKEITEEYGAIFVHHDWPGYAKQKNWGLDELPFEAEWILIVDADEVITPKLRAIIEDIVFEDVTILKPFWWAVWIGPQQQHEPGSVPLLGRYPY